MEIDWGDLTPMANGEMFSTWRYCCRFKCINHSWNDWLYECGIISYHAWQSERVGTMDQSDLSMCTAGEAMGTFLVLQKWLPMSWIRLCRLWDNP